MNTSAPSSPALSREEGPITGPGDLRDGLGPHEENAWSGGGRGRVGNRKRNPFYLVNPLTRLTGKCNVPRNAIETRGFR